MTPLDYALRTNDGASQGEQSEMSLKRTLETNAQLAEAGKPGMRVLDNPAMLAEPVVLLDATASDPGSDGGARRYDDQRAFSMSARSVPRSAVAAHN